MKLNYKELKLLSLVNDSISVLLNDELESESKLLVSDSILISLDNKSKSTISK